MFATSSSLLAVLCLVLGCRSELQSVVKWLKVPVYQYSSYSDVNILNYDIPDDTTLAVFRFAAVTESTSIFGGCSEDTVVLHLKPASYAIANPDSSYFPSTFFNYSISKHETLRLTTNNGTYYMNLTSPILGPWYSIHYIDWSNPDNSKIEQQGLSAECDTYLYASLLIEQELNIPIVALNEDFVVKLTNRSYSKFYVPEGVQHVAAVVEASSLCEFCTVVVTVQANKLPNEDDFLSKIVINNTDTYLLQIWSQEEAWHYLRFEYNSDSANQTGELKVILKSVSSILDKENSETVLRARKLLLQKDKSLQTSLIYKEHRMVINRSPELFTYSFYLQSINGSIPLVLNITDTEMTVLKIVLNHPQDIGGTLEVSAVTKPVKVEQIASVPNCTIVGCIQLNIKEIPTFPDQCFYNNNSHPAPFVLNSLTTEVKTGDIPFPDMGNWYVTFRSFCGKCEDCDCMEKCEVAYAACVADCERGCSPNECNDCFENCRSQVIDTKECSSCDCYGSCESADSSGNVTMYYDISSSPCVDGKCNGHGRCNRIISSLSLFSACECTSGYRGWGCTDSRFAKSTGDILASVLLLTLSNLLFIWSVYAAYRRRYLVHAVVYAFTMFFSTFYHACDVEDSAYAFCMFKLNVLQFCDFYCALLSFWITFIAVSYIREPFVSIAHMAGAILLAFATTMDRTALWVFLLPSVTGIVILLLNWGLHCKRTRTWFPSRRYLKINLPIGGGLVVVGLICYAFLQTQENYKYLHSLWHLIVAGSIVILLPNEYSFLPSLALDD